MTRNLLPLALTVLLCACAGFAGPIPGYDNLVFEDEFEGTEVDETKWTYWRLGQWDAAVALYSEEAVIVTDGHLELRTYTDYGSDPQSSDDDVHYTGMLASVGKFEHAYGYWEARISFNDAPGTLSAFWLHTDWYAWDRNEIPSAPAEEKGIEIDIMEHRDSVPNRTFSALHWNDEYWNHGSVHTESIQSDLLDDTYHTYGVLWTETGYTFYYDGIPIWVPSGVPVSQVPEFILLTTIVRQNWFGGMIPPEGYGTYESSDTRMRIDYVRVWSNVPEPSAICVFLIPAILPLFRFRQSYPH